jgi:TRAP-type mannitol/chloroaromatic compound transport system permease large subunit
MNLTLSIEWITILMFGSMLLIMLMGLPVAFSCGTVGVIFTALLQGPSAVNLVPTRIFGLMTNYLLAAIPLFILMACIAERGGLIKDIYEAVYQWSGPLRGGVAHASIIACTMMAAMVGVIGASEVTMGLIALPEMLRRRYDKYLAIGRSYTAWWTTAPSVSSMPERFCPVFSWQDFTSDTWPSAAP